MISAKVEGINDVVKGFRLTNEETQKAVKVAIDRTAYAVETDAKKKLKSDKHIITGRLFSSIHAEAKEGQSYDYIDNNGKSFNGSLEEPFDQKNEAIAGTNVVYAPFIEFGTKYFSGDSFLGHAATVQEPKLKKRVEDEIEKAIKRIWQ